MREQSAGHLSFRDPKQSVTYTYFHSEDSYSGKRPDALGDMDFSEHQTFHLEWINRFCEISNAVRGGGCRPEPKSYPKSKNLHSPQKYTHPTFIPSLASQTNTINSTRRTRSKTMTASKTKPTPRMVRFATPQVDQLPHTKKLKVSVPVTPDAVRQTVQDPFEIMPCLEACKLSPLSVIDEWEIDPFDCVSFRLDEFSGQKPPSETYPSEILNSASSSCSYPKQSTQMTIDTSKALSKFRELGLFPALHFRRRSRPVCLFVNYMGIREPKLALQSSRQQKGKRKVCQMTFMPSDIPASIVSLTSAQSGPSISQDSLELCPCY